MVETATTTAVKEALCRIAVRFDTMADQREREEHGRF
jgi:hypothetical protein